MDLGLAFIEMITRAKGVDFVRSKDRASLEYQLECHYQLSKQLDCLVNVRLDQHIDWNGHKRINRNSRRELQGVQSTNTTDFQGFLQSKANPVNPLTNEESEQTSATFAK